MKINPTGVAVVALDKDLGKPQSEINMALERVELPTHGLGNRCSIQLSYRANPSSDFKFQIAD